MSEMDKHESEKKSVLSTLTEQRMQEQMDTLDKFYHFYDAGQWLDVANMEPEVLEIAQEFRSDPTVIRVAGGIYGYLGTSYDQLGQKDKAQVMHNYAHVIARECGEIE